ncbi:MAG: carboxypeptidase-like regulatory domain-containing protein [Patiriisocius sp.]|uniref:carboxypeptidase-like regulatory domain-containing protein n=1 Tax=Patiriisocius sp. TaxID=2822396 RepID=UPI003EF0FC36
MKTSILKFNIYLIVFLTVFTTAAQTVFRGTVINQETNEPLENARVGVIGQGVGAITNDNGSFTYRKYHEVLDNGSILKVSAPGYKTLTNDVSVIRQMMNNRGIIYLKTQEDSDAEKHPKKVAVFWDASQRSRSRDINSEKIYLKEYLSNRNFSEISLIIFNETIVFSQTYKKHDGAISEVIAAIDAIKYKGFSDFGNINYNEVDEVLLISQQKPTLGKPQIDQETPFSIVNFNAREDAESYFKDITNFTFGSYKDSLESGMQTVIPEENDQDLVSGMVTSSNNGVHYAMVVKEGSIEEYYTNEQGIFTVPAIPGDTLTFYCLGHYPKKITVSEQDFYNVTLAAKAEILDEVFLNGKMSKTPEYNYDEKAQTDKIDGGRRVPIRTIYKEDWKKGAGQISEIIDGWHGVDSGVDRFGWIRATVKGTCARFIVDGVEMPGEQINVSVIERITIYAAYMSVVPCPSRIIITTKFHPDIIDQKLRSYGIDPLKNNNYTEEVPSLESKKGVYFKESMITGTVFSNNVPIQNVSVFKQGALKEYTTDNKGEFSLPASNGDVLVFKHLGMYHKTVLITEENNYNISLAAKSEVLNEVELVTRVEKIDSKYDFYDEENRVEYVDGKKYNVVEVFSKKELNMSGKDIFGVLKSTSPRIVVVGPRSQPEMQFYYRKNNQLIPLTTIVDGGYGTANAINPAVIERVSIYIAPNKRDSKIFITTRNHPDIYKKFLEDNDIALKNNTYTEEIQQIGTNRNNYFNEKKISGVVTSNNEPLQYVSIFKKGALDEVVTAVDGSFNLTVAEGDILLLKHIGMYPKTVLISEEDNYHIELINKTQVLDTAVIESEKKEKKILTETAFGKKDRKSVGYSVDDGLSNFIDPADIDFTQVANRLPNIVVDQRSGTIFHQRSFGAMSASPMMIVLDDIPISQETLRTIDPQTITNITSLGSVASTVKYGSQAFGGALLITTKNNVGASVTNKKKDYTIKNNDYKEEVAVLNFNAVADGYIDDLTRENSIKVKLETYQKLKSEYIDKVDFYVDMALYFQNLDAGAATVVRSDFAQIAGDNIKALRVLAYLNEYAGEYLNAQKIYERVLELDPSQPQSYRDMALIYQETGEYNKSLELYINMLGNQIKGLDFSALEVPVSNELKRLISLHKRNIDFDRLPNDWLEVNFNIDVRLTLDWSDPNAPFEFQFVDPKKKFYTWQSDIEKKGKNTKNVSEEFIVDDADSGKWLVNIRYTGQEGEIHIPPYLKYTIYKDYGTVNEEKTVKLVRLDTQLDKATLDSFVY